MKNIKKPVFFILALSILLFSALTTIGVSTYYGDNRSIWIKGVKDIRWGIDIRGGVDVTFTPDPEYSDKVADSEIDGAESIIIARMISKNITDYETYKDYNSKRIIVRFPWQSGDMTFDPKTAVDELGETAMLTFREGDIQYEDDFNYEDLPIILSGTDVKSAARNYDYEKKQYIVALEFNDEGTEKFSNATTEMAAAGGGIISIWMDDILISNPRATEAILSSNAQITGGAGGFDPDEAKELADKINGGALPFKLQVESFSTISPTLGLGARDAMAIAGAFSFVIVCIYMILRYKMPGVVASFGLAGQTFGSLAIISGFFGFSDSFTLTIPGIAGIILSIGMGVDANVITAERIKEEIRSGKTLDGAVQSGYKRAFSAIFDGNITMLIVAFILMGAFGTPGSVASTVLSPLFFWFGPSAAGAIYAFGYTLIIGVILNFVFGVFTSRLMTYSIIKFKAFRKLSFYGGYKNDAHKAECEKPKKIFNAVANRKKFLIAPIAITSIAIVLMLFIGLEIAIEFKGGSVLSYPYTGEIDTDQVKSLVESEGMNAVSVATGTSLDSDLKTITISFTSGKATTTDDLDYLESRIVDEFKNIKNDDILKTERQSISPTMGRAFFLKCLVAVIFSFLVLMAYIAFQFKTLGGLTAGFFSIIALVINVMVVFAVFVFFQFPIDANFIAVILTILCYSLNDTIVVFDRVRENRTLLGKKTSYTDLVNSSIAQSFTRSLNTTIATCISMLAICVISVITGIESMFTFAFPMLIGIFSGFMSSLFIAGPLWAVWKSRAKK